MAQLFWQIPNEKGPEYQLGLFHGEQSGHLLLYCGTKILRIDFSIFQDKTYSFFLGETMYELHLKRQKTGINYQLKNAESGEYLSPYPSSAEEKGFPSDKYIVIMISVIIILAGILIFFFIQHR